MREPYLKDLSEQLCMGFQSQCVAKTDISGVRTGSANLQLVTGGRTRIPLLSRLKGRLRAFWKWLERQNEVAAQYHESIERAKDEQFRKHYQDPRWLR